MARKSNRAAQGTGTLRKKTITRNGTPYTYWEAHITLGRDTGTGKQIQKSIYGKTQKEVREKMQPATVAFNNDEYFEPSRMTVGRWIDIWLSEYCSDKKNSTMVNYKSQCENHVDRRISND